MIFRLGINKVEHWPHLRLSYLRTNFLKGSLLFNFLELCPTFWWAPCIICIKDSSNVQSQIWILNGLYCSYTWLGATEESMKIASCKIIIDCWTVAAPLNAAAVQMPVLLCFPVSKRTMALGSFDIIIRSELNSNKCGYYSHLYGSWIS